MNIEVPKNVSQNLLQAIQGALEEERKPASHRILKVAGLSILSVLVLLTPLLLIFRKEVSMAWYLAAFLWWCFFTVGFYLHLSPQPRLEVAGHWSPFIFARILIVSAFLTCVEIVICPSFVFLESPLGWSPFEGMTHWFMRWGGMRACMFFCGAIFSSIGGIATFFIVAKTVRGGRLKTLVRPFLLLLLTQIPVFIIQAWDPSLWPFLPFWIMGCLGGITLAILIVRVFTRKILLSR